MDKKIFKTILFPLLGFFVSAFIGGVVNSYLSKAKPKVEIASIDFLGSLTKEEPIILTSNFAEEYRITPIALEGLGSQQKIKYEDLETYAKFIDYELGNLESAINVIKNTIKAFNDNITVLSNC
jgi:hypothetical protein